MNTLEVQATTLESSTAGWPTKLEAAAALGVTTKTLEKYVQQGKLIQRMQSQINRPQRAVIDPDTLGRMVAERALPKEEQAEIIPPDHSENLLKLLSTLLPAHWPIYLTLSQAVAYTGLTETYLEKLVERGKLTPLEGMRKYRYKRSDLDLL